MGDPRRLKKKFKKPRHPFRKDRIIEELEFVGKYGLRNKREFWKARTILGNWRNIARSSRSLPPEKAAQVQETLLKSLNRLGILGSEAEFEDVLKRRLQTLVYEKGLAKTIYQARQFIVHKHIQVGGKTVNSPSYLVKKEEEDTIRFAPSSPYAMKKEQETFVES